MGQEFYIKLGDGTNFWAVDFWVKICVKAGMVLSKERMFQAEGTVCFVFEDD